jgi:hypothetical protein
MGQKRDEEYSQDLMMRQTPSHASPPGRSPTA